MHKKSIVTIALIFIGLVVSVLPVSALPITTQDMTVINQATLEANFFDPAVTTYSNFALIGSDYSIGIYDGATEFDIPTGVVISSGDIYNIIGPNLSDSATLINNTPGDVDLDVLAQVWTYDAAGFEFDITPTKEYLVFHYLFGSEEYNEYVGSYNDVFGFFVDGVNCAVFSNGEYVSVNNVNNFTNRQY
ncbi:MAG TPA: choice-of-anchor L domain-containing protein, partial [Candidatus Methanofastidiosa archaeon]|nr:choice-of-anchor L domain-containing protein [Candidatus Methanofastidiosa archaeon]